MRAGLPPIVYGSGTQTRDFVYLSDCVRVQAQDLPLAVEGTFNLCTGRGTSIAQLMGHLARLTGYAGPVHHLPALEHEARASVLDPARAESAIGWRMTVPLEDGLRLASDALASTGPGPHGGAQASGDRLSTPPLVPGAGREA